MAFKIAFGPRAGMYVRRIAKGFGYEEEIPFVQARQCASINGFTIHAGRHVGAQEREKLAQLISYASRPPLATERLSESQDGELIYIMKKMWCDGTQSVKLSPYELLEKLVAMVPPPRSHMTRYHGCLASHSKLRREIVLRPDIKKGFVVDGCKARLGWAKLLARVFKIDVTKSDLCGGEMQLVATVVAREREYPQVSRTRRAHRAGLVARRPPVRLAVGLAFDEDANALADDYIQVDDHDDPA